MLVRMLVGYGGSLNSTNYSLTGLVAQMRKVSAFDSLHQSLAEPAFRDNLHLARLLKMHLPSDPNRLHPLRRVPLRKPCLHVSALEAADALGYIVARVEAADDVARFSPVFLPVEFQQHEAAALPGGLVDDEDGVVVGLRVGEEEGGGRNGIGGAGVWV